jgi:hypothetical protein
MNEGIILKAHNYFLPYSVHSHITEKIYLPFSVYASTNFKAYKEI